MSYALHQGGVLLGLMSFILLGVVTDYSLIILIKSGHLAGSNSYAGVMSAAFGTPGYVVLSILQFIYPVIGNPFIFF
jgi:solute carrier family 38 (sodium-coupled neutral amino acid transporter), member 11